MVGCAAKVVFNPAAGARERERERQTEEACAAPTTPTPSAPNRYSVPSSSLDLSSTPVPRPTVPNIGSTLSNTATDAYIVPLTAPELPPLDSLPPPLSAQTYIYAGPLKGLSPELWSYEDFVRENAWKWVGRGAHDNEYYIEVDRRREMDGKTLKTEIVDGGGIPGSDSDGKSVAVEVQGP